MATCGIGYKGDIEGRVERVVTCKIASTDTVKKNPEM